MYIVKEGKFYKVYAYNCKVLFISDNLQNCEKFLLDNGETLI